MIAAGGGKIDFSAGGLTNLSGTTLSGGSFTVDAGSILQLSNNAEIATLTSDLTLSGMGSVVQGFDITSNTEIGIEITLTTIAADGALNVLGGRSYTTTDAMTDAGSLAVGRGTTFTAAALTVASGGSLDVAAGAVLNLGSSLTIAGTATNAGRINGGGATAVSMASGTGTLILAPSFAFGGTVSGGGTGSTLELAKGPIRGILDGIGTSFTSFGTVTVDPGATWTVDALATALPGTRINGSGGSNVLTLKSAGAVNLAGVTGFPKINLTTGDNTVTVFDKTLGGGAVTINAGISGTNQIDASDDTNASAGTTLKYISGTGSGSFVAGFENDVIDVSGDTKTSVGKVFTFTAGSGIAEFTGGFENDVVESSAAAVSRDTLTGGVGGNTLDLTNAGTVNLAGVSRFGTISLATGNNTITITDNTLSGGAVTIIGDTAGSNIINAAGDTKASTDKTLSYVTKSGLGAFTGGFENDVIDASGDGSSSTGETLTFIAGSGSASFTGGFENDIIQASAAAVSRDTLVGGRGSNTLSLTTAGVVNLAEVENFGTIDLASGNNTVEVTDTTLTGGAVTIVAGASGDNIISAVRDTAASKGKILTYVAGIGADKFTGGFESDVVKVGAAAVGDDTLGGGSGGKNTLDLTSAGAVGLAGVARFETVRLASGDNTVSLSDNTLSGGRVAITAGASGTNSISANGDTATSTGKTLSYVTRFGSGAFIGGFENDVVDASGDGTSSKGQTFTFTTGSGASIFTGGFENDVVNVTAGVISGDTLTGGNGENTLVLTSAGTFDLSMVADFGTIKLAPGDSTVTVTDSTLSGGAVTIVAGATGNDVIIVADSAASRGKTLTYVAAGGTDTFIGGFEDDTVEAGAAAVGGDSLAGGRGSNTLDLLTAGAVGLADVKNFRTINLASGNNTVTVVDNTLSGGKVTIRAASGGNNIISAASDTTISEGKILTYVAAGGADKFTGGFENDVVRVGAAALGGDTLTGGSGSNTLELTSAGTIRAGGVTGIEIFVLDNNPGNVLHLASTNFVGVAGKAITVDGGSGGNTISEAGAAAADRVVMNGGDGGNTFIAGQDAVMTGGGGKDVFELTMPGTIATPDTNTIKDFHHGIDQVAFSEAGFSLGPNPVAATLFTSSPTGRFTTLAQRFAYDTSNGRLFYDAQGDAPGSSRIEIATLSGQPNLTVSDIAFAA